MGASCGGALRRAVASVGGCLVLLAAGCTSTSGSADAHAAIDTAVAQASSAVATAQLTVELLREGRVTVAVADTSLSDQLAVLSAADHSLTGIVAPDASVRGWNEDARAAIAASGDAVLDARSWVAHATGAPGGTQVADGLEEAALALTVVADELDAAGSGA